METTSTHYARCKIALRESRLFNRIDDAALNQIFAGIGCEHWPVGTFKNNGDFCGNHFYCIVSGRVKMYQINPMSGRYYTIEIMKAGDCFDVLGLLNDEGHDVYFETLDEIEVLSIPMISLRTWMAQHSEFNRFLLQYMAKRICQLEKAATDMCLSNTLSRLANLLTRNTDSGTKRLKVIDNLSNEELAGMLGTTRAVVNRNIQQLKECGAIGVSRKHIEVLNKMVLDEIASSASA